MRLIKSLMNRLSDSPLLSVPNRLMEASGLALARPRPRATSILLPQTDAPARRSAHHAGQLETIDEAIRKSQAWFLARQDQAEGYWVAELEADTTLTSEYLMLRRFVDRVDPERERKAVRYLKSAQLSDGGWPIYHGGPSEISASVKAYFALKLAGV
jgi:squalene-hopene/tetraprenyl-beta-curcumene cyclase